MDDFIKEYLILYKLYTNSGVCYNEIIFANSLTELKNKFNDTHKNDHKGYTDDFYPVIMRIL